MSASPRPGAGTVFEGLLTGSSVDEEVWRTSYALHRVDSLCEMLYQNIPSAILSVFLIVVRVRDCWSRIISGRLCHYSDFR